MVRNAYGCRLTRQAVPHPSQLIADDMMKAEVTISALSAMTNIPQGRIHKLAFGDGLPTPTESESIGAALGRGKMYYAKRAKEWKEENT